MTHYRSIAIALALTGIAAGTALNAQSPANPNRAAVQAGTYAVEAGHTRVQFTVSHIGFSDWYGDFTHVSGSLKIDPAKIAASKVDITIPVSSVTTTNAKLDDELRGDQWFDAGKYPTMQFVSTSVVKTGARTAKITGQLTFHGVTKPVTLNASFNAAGVNPLSKGYTVGFNATTAIKRSDFGVKTYLPLIGDDVTIRISAAFEKQG